MATVDTSGAASLAWNDAGRARTLKNTDDLTLLVNDVLLGLRSGSANDLKLRLGDAAGARSLLIQDNAGVTRARFDSSGGSQFDRLFIGATMGTPNVRVRHNTGTNQLELDSNFAAGGASVLMTQTATLTQPGVTVRTSIGNLADGAGLRAELVRTAALTVGTGMSVLEGRFEGFAADSAGAFLSVFLARPPVTTAFPGAKTAYAAVATGSIAPFDQVLTAVGQSLVVGGPVRTTDGAGFVTALRGGDASGAVLAAGGDVEAVGGVGVAGGDQGRLRIAPAFYLSGAGTVHHGQWGAGSTAPVSPASTMRLRYNEGVNTAQVSLGGGAYVDLAVAGGPGSAGWTDDGANVRLTTAADTVSVGTAVPFATTKFSIVAPAGQFGLVVRTNGADDDTQQEVFRTERSDGVSRVRIDGRGHMALSGATNQGTAGLFADKTPSATLRWRGLWSRSSQNGAVTVAGLGVVGAFVGEARAIDGSTSDGSLTVGDEGIPPGGVYVAGVFAAEQDSTTVAGHSGDFSGAFGFAGGRTTVAARVLAAITRANGIAGQVGYNTEAVAAGATGVITNGAALRALSPAGTSAGRTITTNRGTWVSNQGATGVTTAIGLDVDAQSGAATANLGVRTQSAVVIGAAGLLGTELLRVVGDVRVAGDCNPAADNTGNIGTDALRWTRVRAVTVATGDLELRAPDGSADWTVREAADGLYVYDNLTGRKYRLPLELVE